MSEPVDILIVGAGAAGGVLAKELAEKGLRVMVLEAGPLWDPQRDFVSDELVMEKLGWQDPREVSGSDPLQLGRNNSGKGVGGGTTHFTAVLLRFFPSDFKTKSLDGVGADWPIAYTDLEGYYTKLEKEIGVSGPHHYPWGAFSGPYPYPARNPLSANAEVFRIGCERLGIPSVPTPQGINSAPFDGRPPCINRGFCGQGCLPNAKFSTLVHHIPKAVAMGAKVVPEAMVTQVLVDKSGKKATGVVYVKDGQEHRQEARVVVLSAYCIETPRLLLNSACPSHPNGLANDNGLVGKNLMTHSGHEIYARFDKEIRPYKGTPIMATTQHFYETDPKNDHARGFTLHAHGARPLSFIKPIAQAYRLWGEPLRRLMADYNHYARITMVGEVLPQPANQVTLTDKKDAWGLPIPKVTFSYGDNDKKLIAHAVRAASEILEAAGGKVEYIAPDTAHLMGGCPMGNDPKTSVVNANLQTHAIPNLMVVDASVFVTSGGGNPTLTVMALAARAADFIRQAMQKGDL